MPEPNGGPFLLLPAPNRRYPFGHRRVVQDRQDTNGFARSRACSSRSSSSSSPLPFLLLDAVCRHFDSRQEPSRGWHYLTAVIYGWEFFAGGSVLEYTYYFSYFADLDRADDGVDRRAGHLSRSVALAGERRSRSGGNDRGGGRRSGSSTRASGLIGQDGRA